MRKARNTEGQRLIHILLVTLVLVLVASIVVILGSFGIGIPCVIYEWTGILCPGCGNTRAVISVLCGEWKAAFSYNLMFLPQIAYILWVYLFCSFRYVKGKRFSYYNPPFPAVDIMALAAFLLWGVVRNFLKY